MERWVGKIAVVTGASVGIGAAIVTTLADNGLIVVGLARREDAIKALAVKSKGKIHAIKCDMTKEEDILKAFQWIAKNVGEISLMINNAGVLHSGPLTDPNTQNWRDMLNVNILALTICTRETLVSMKKKGGDGHIINVNSIAGHMKPIANFVMYSASKHAVTALSEGTRAELARENSPIKVTSLSPGLVHTDMGVDVLKKITNGDGLPAGEGRPNGFLTSQDLADTVISIISMKPYIQISELTLQCLEKF